MVQVTLDLDFAQGIFELSYNITYSAYELKYIFHQHISQTSLQPLGVFLMLMTMENFNQHRRPRGLRAP